MSDQPGFPLTAEQIVRGAAFLLAQVVNANRHPSDRIGHHDLTLDLADAMGVSVAREPHPHGGDILLPYGHRRSAEGVGER